MGKVERGCPSAKGANILILKRRSKVRGSRCPRWEAGITEQVRIIHERTFNLLDGDFGSSAVTADRHVRGQGAAVSLQGSVPRVN